MRENIKELIAIQAAHRFLLKMFCYAILIQLPPEARHAVLKELYNYGTVEASGMKTEADKVDAPDVARATHDYLYNFIDELVAMMSPEAGSPQA